MFAGAVLLHMMTGQWPYAHLCMSSSDTRPWRTQKAIDEQIAMFSNGCADDDKACVAVLRKCLAVNVDNRATVNDILSAKWLNVNLPPGLVSGPDASRLFATQVCALTQPVTFTVVLTAAEHCRLEHPCAGPAYLSVANLTSDCLDIEDAMHVYRFGRAHRRLHQNALISFCSISCACRCQLRYYLLHPVLLKHRQQPGESYAPLYLCMSRSCQAEFA